MLTTLSFGARPSASIFFQPSVFFLNLLLYVFMFSLLTGLCTAVLHLHHTQGPRTWGVAAVWQQMRGRLLSYVGFTFLFILVTAVGLLFLGAGALVFPVWIALSHAIAVNEHASFGKALRRSFRYAMSDLGTLILLQLLVGVSVLIWGLYFQALVIGLIAFLADFVVNSPMEEFRQATVALSSLGYLGFMLVGFSIGIFAYGLVYYSLCEKLQGLGTLQRVELIGQRPSQSAQATARLAPHST
jgi:hypothetical protein